jgi:hypothetical protein
LSPWQARHGAMRCSRLSANAGATKLLNSTDAKTTGRMAMFDLNG